MFSFAHDSVTAYNSIFDRCVPSEFHELILLQDTDNNERVAKEFRFSELPEYIGVAAKENHTAVEKWPYRLKLEPEHGGAKKESDMMMRRGPGKKGR